MTTQPETDDTLSVFLQEHDGCTWQQVGPCVWCKDHGLRLYQGSLPERKRTVPRCAALEHDWDPEMGMGFYQQCRTCGETEWFECLSDREDQRPVAARFR